MAATQATGRSDRAVAHGHEMASAGSSRRRATGRALGLAALALLAACAPREHFMRSRWNDAVQVLPLDVGLGGGIHAAVQATRFVGVGFGGAMSLRVGLKPPDTWRDSQAFGPRDDPLPYRGPGLWPQIDLGLPGWFSWSRDVQNAHGLSGPERGNTWVVVPVFEDDFFGYDLVPPTIDPGPPGGWLDVDARVFVLLVGLRVGFSPIEAVDWLAGWCGLDPLGDDVPDSAGPGDPEGLADPDVDPVEAALAVPPADEA